MKYSLWPEISETGKRVKSFPKHAFMWQIWGLSFNKTGNGFLGGGGGSDKQGGLKKINLEFKLLLFACH